MPTIERACETAGIALHDVDAIAVTSGPGLAGALLVGVAAAKALALGLGKPLYGVNHLAAHVAVDQLEHGPLPEPCLALLVSGGHSSLLRVTDVTGGIDPLGATIDDAAGEAFDKVARLLGLPFPGGPHIDRVARDGDSVYDRLPARPDLPPRPRAAPLRLLVLRAQDRGRPLGRGPGALRRAGAGRRRRGVVPGGRLRRAGPQGARRRRDRGDRGPAHRRRRGGQLPAAGDGRGARRRRSASGSGCRDPACAPTTARWSPRSAPRWSPAAARRPRSTCRPTRACRSPPSSSDGQPRTSGARSLVVDPVLAVVEQVARRLLLLFVLLAGAAAGADASRAGPPAATGSVGAGATTTSADRATRARHATSGHAPSGGARCSSAGDGAAGGDRPAAAEGTAGADPAGAADRSYAA